VIRSIDTPELFGKSVVGDHLCFLPSLLTDLGLFNDTIIFRNSVKDDCYGRNFLLSNFKIRQMCLAIIIKRKEQLKNISDTVAEEKNNKKI
jgi:hypothetical protein